MRFDLKDYLGIAIVLMAVAVLALHERMGDDAGPSEASDVTVVSGAPADGG